MTPARTKGTSDKPRSYFLTMPSGKVVTKNKCNVYHACSNDLLEIDKEVDPLPFHTAFSYRTIQRVSQIEFLCIVTKRL